MQAIVYEHYGPPDALQLREMEDPVIGETEVLVRVRAASANPLDWFAFNGTPYIARPGFGLKKPDSARLGADLAGVVEAVGGQGTGFEPRDEVFGIGDGSFAEFAVVGKNGALSSKPTNLTFEEAAAVPVAGLTALQGLRDKGGIRPGQQVLINGASGGVGTFAVQIAKAFDTEVTAVCSTRNVDAVRALGADRVVDYTREDFTRESGRYDLMLDVAGSRPWSEAKRALKPDARVVIVGGPKTNRWLGPLGHIIGMSLASLPASQKTSFFISKADGDDLATLTDLIESGKIAPVVEQTYPLARVAEAMVYLGSGHARGKLVIKI